MGLLWRLFAPKGLKRARRAMHPGWVIEDAIVRSARKKRRARSRAPTFYGTCTFADGSYVACSHAHRTPQAAETCVTREARRMGKVEPVSCDGIRRG